MAIYSVNQNRQFYVITSVVTSTPTTEGQLQVGATADGKQVFFKHMGKGGLTRTDLIDVDKVCYAKISPKADMQRKLKQALVTLDSNVNEGNPIAGQDYILRMQINNYLAPGDACVLIKSGAVHATKNMTAAQFYARMADSLNKSFSREPQALLTFGAVSGSAVTYTDSTAYEVGTILSYSNNLYKVTTKITTSDSSFPTSKATKISDGIVITEVGNQPWRRGLISDEGVSFEAIPTTVLSEGEDVIWGVVEYSDTDTVVGNGRKIADIEYFCQAERGDMFRDMGWPNNIDVKYMVDPDSEYDVLDLHYFFSDPGVQVHRSEKDITIVTATTSVMTALKTTLASKGITVSGGA